MRRVLFCAAFAMCAACTSQADLTCAECAPGAGGVRIALTVGSADVARVVATVTAPDLPAPVSQALTVAGTPPTASGTIPDVPAGPGRVVTLEAFPAAPEDALVVHRGSATTDVAAGQLSPVSILLRPVVKDLSVTATFPAGDVDVARVASVAVTVTGARIRGSATWYLAIDAAAGTASGVVPAVPVGAVRTVTVTAHDAAGAVVHQGSAETSILESAAAAAGVALVNQAGTGAIPVTGGFCTPDCAAKACGDDGCGGSCGGCLPGVACEAGVCGATASPLPPGWSDDASTGSASGPWGVWGSAANDVWAVGRGIWLGRERVGVRRGPVLRAPLRVGQLGDRRLGGGIRAGRPAHRDPALGWRGVDARRRDGPLRADVVGRPGLLRDGRLGGRRDARRALGREHVVDLRAGDPERPPAQRRLGVGAGRRVDRRQRGGAHRPLGRRGVVRLVRAARHPVGRLRVRCERPLGRGQRPRRQRSPRALGRSTWTPTAVGTNPFYSVWGSAPDDVWAGSSQGNAAHWDGSAWTLEQTGTSATYGLWDLWGSSATDVWGMGWDSRPLTAGGVIVHYGG